MKLYLSVIHDHHADPDYKYHDSARDAGAEMHAYLEEEANAEEGDWAEVICIDTDTKLITWPDPESLV